MSEQSCSHKNFKKAIIGWDMVLWTVFQISKEDIFHEVQYYNNGLSEGIIGPIEFILKLIILSD